MVFSVLFDDIVNSSSDKKRNCMMNGVMYCADGTM